MIKRCILFLMLSLCSRSKAEKDIFNLDADDMFASEMGEDIYEVRKRLNKIPDDQNDTPARFATFKELNTTDLEFNTTAPDVTTTERYPMASIPPEIAAKQMNISLRELKKKRLLQQLKRVLSNNRSVMDYLTDSNVDTLTRRFDQIVDGNKNRREMYYHVYDNVVRKRDAKKHLLNLMSHFVYVTRYKLVIPQLLRTKYQSSPIYKLGFLFALLRHLKNMQKWLYWALITNGQDSSTMVGTVYYDLKILEKIQRLDVDIKDVVLVIQKTEYRANIAFNPRFYEQSIES